ncbi:hypothetical protein BJ944DRAFT_267036 [Cunninghamella echinulata]|nr:hypothetical protein BJ944DRAFT_267036 [Cunninghamella echinulata]
MMMMMMMNGGAGGGMNPSMQAMMQQQQQQMMNPYMMNGYQQQQPYGMMNSAANYMNPYATPLMGGQSMYGNGMYGQSPYYGGGATAGGYGGYGGLSGNTMMNGMYGGGNSTMMMNGMYGGGNNAMMMNGMYGGGGNGMIYNAAGGGNMYGNNMMATSPYDMEMSNNYPYYRNDPYSSAASSYYSHGYGGGPRSNLGMGYNPYDPYGSRRVHFPERSSSVKNLWSREY